MSFYGLNSLNMQTASVAQQHTIPKIDPKAEDAELRKQTDAFEAVIVKMMMDNAMQDEKNLFSEQNDPGDKIYKSMYRDELSKASAGSFGFSQMLYDYLSQKK
ncbi:Rod binding protein [Epsilonproteobacteria bacterium SCGC AD-308-O04]|jgi:peptidoglycan hydrolase FlgJ|nr:Rod binding protein [Epsilonproteobacteria bacterium SCGC AD-308-O04]